KGRKKITLKKPQADLLQRLQHQKGVKSTADLTGGLLDQTGDNTPFLSTNREGVVQSRLLRFGTLQSPSHGSRESSPAPSDASASSGSTLISRNGTHELDLSQKHRQNNIHDSTGNSIGSSEKTVFGISPKSNSLSR